MTWIGFVRWLGRQVGYVKQAVQTDPAAAPKLPVPTAAPMPAPKKLYENKTIEESAHPELPNIKLRRTIIDEAIQEGSRSDER